MTVLQHEKATLASRGDGFFLWSVVLLVMSGACFASWIGSFYVVGHPEDPRCYRILKKFGKVEPPKRFKVVEAPKGEFLTAARLLERFGKLGKLELARENAELLRTYVMNFKEAKKRVQYVAGKFHVVQSYDLGGGDMFPSGAVAIAQAEALPQVFVEYIFPAAPANVATVRAVLATGAEIAVERAHDLWALLHVTRHADGRMQFTVVPLPYGAWKLKKSGENFELDSPERLSRDFGLEMNIAAGLPIVRDPRLARGLAAYRDFRRKAMASGADDQAALAGPELVRFEKPAVDTDFGTPAAGNRRAAADAETTEPAQTPAPAVPLAHAGIARVSPNPGIIGAMPATTVPPAPPAAAPVREAPSASRVLSVGEASQLVGKYGGGEPTLLSGDFVVTGVLGRLVALRTRDSLRDPDADPARPGSSAALIVVDFPEGATPPAKDTGLTRDSARGFLIRDVVRGHNDQITVFASERVQP